MWKGAQESKPAFSVDDKLWLGGTKFIFRYVVYANASKCFICVPIYVKRAM